MKSVFSLDVHRLREFCTAKNEGVVNVQTQPAEGTDSNEIDLTFEETADDGCSMQVPGGSSNHCDAKALNFSWPSGS